MFVQVLTVCAVVMCAEALEEHLGKELDNGRIVRSLVKLGFINERPEHNRDARWSETVRANPLSLSSSTLVGFGSEVDLGLASWL